MHKPIRIIRDDARVRLTQQVNLTSALRTALLTLPAQFTQRELFTAIASISYSGDPRMILPAENRGKVANMVERQEVQFRELYWRLAQGLPGVRWRVDSQMIEQDTSAHARAAHLKKLPEELLTQVHARAHVRGPPREADESAYWLRVAGDTALSSILRSGAFMMYLLSPPYLDEMAMPRRRDEQNRTIPGYCAVAQGRCERRIVEEYTLYHGQGWEVLEGITDSRRISIISVLSRALVNLSPTSCQT